LPSLRIERMFVVMDDVLALLERRYGDRPDSPELAALTMRRNRNREQIRVLIDRIAELQDELNRLRSEDLRMESVQRLLVEHLADRFRASQGEGWSPQPVIGYRLWTIDANGHLAGATGRRWERPAMTATCQTAEPGDELPHTAHRCSNVGHGCGIYAVKNVGSLAGMYPEGCWVLGIVLLSGKVVEHEHGYRAETANVAAALAVAEDTHLVTADIGVLQLLFTNPTTTIDRLGEPGPGPRNGLELVEAMEKLERRIETWT
jgi:hypothetical protein